MLEVDQLLLLEKLMRRGIPSTNEINEMNEVIYKHKKIGIEESLKDLRAEREKYSKLLNASSSENRDEVLQTITVLTRTERTLQQTLLKMNKTKDWKGGKSIE